MTPREPDRSYDAGHDLWKRLQGQGTSNQIGILIAALRQAADEALERALSCVPGKHIEIGDRIRALASPAVAPAAEWKCDACGDELASESAQRRHEATWHGAAPAADQDEVATFGAFGHGEHSEPVAPSLLPRVLAALETEQLSYDREYPRRKELVALAAELRRYIAGVEADPRDKRIAELETAIRWACGEGDEFPTRQPGEGAYWWRTELRRRAALADGGEGK